MIVSAGAPLRKCLWWPMSQRQLRNLLSSNISQLARVADLQKHQSFTYTDHVAFGIQVHSDPKESPFLSLLIILARKSNVIPTVKLFLHFYHNYGNIPGKVMGPLYSGSILILN